MIAPLAPYASAFARFAAVAGATAVTPGRSVTPGTPAAAAAVHVHRRRTDPKPPAHVALWLELTNPLRDRPGAGFSMTKMIAAYFAYVVGFSVVALKGVVSNNTLWLAIATLAAAFGKSTFNFLLTKFSRADTSSETHADTRTDTHSETRSVDEHIQETRQLIDERNAHDGSPPRSMPAVGAEVPE